MSARIFCKSAVIAALALAGYQSIRLAAADWLFRANTRQAVERAIALDPGNAHYHAWLAEIEEYEGRDPEPELESAAALNPADSSVWIRRGLRAESEGNFANAEKFLLEAARIDKLYAPRWTLVNYYARHSDAAQTLEWAREAMEIGYGDLAPLFRLCWTVTQDHDAIRAAVPKRGNVLLKYLAFLTQENRLDAAGPVAAAVMESAHPDSAILARYCDRLIEAGRGGEAALVWREMCQRGLLPFDTASILTNGDFRFEPMGLAFDWRVSAEPEIAAARSESQRAMRFHLSGRQPEQIELLWQFVPVEAGKRYRFSAGYRTSWRDAAGLRWRVGELAESPDLAAEDWTQIEMTFTAAALIERIALVYSRPAGSMRAEGEIWIRNATLAPVN
jgi:hypothetical protein